MAALRELGGLDGARVLDVLSSARNGCVAY
jgi:hypothetical protein